MNIYDDYSDDVVGKSLIERTITSYYDDAISRIRQFAFYGCFDLSYVSIPNATYIGEGAFYCCSALSSIVLTSNLITSIGRQAFKSAGISTLSVVVSYIDVAAFAECSNLKNANIYFSGLSQYGTISYYYIHDAMFDGCVNLENIEINYSTINSYHPSYTVTVPNIPDYMFRSCHKLQMSFGESWLSNINRIGSQAFYDCSSLSAVLSFSTTASRLTVYPRAFQRAGITGISMSSLYFDIDFYSRYDSCAVFMNCSNLSFVYCDYMNVVGYSMFQSCSNLETVTIHSGLSKVGGYAFTGCTKLKLFVAPSTVSRFIEAGPFESVASDFVLILKYDGVVTLSTGFVSTYGLFGYNGYSSWKTRKIYVPDSFFASYLSASIWSTVYSSILYSFTDLPSEYSSYIT